MCRAVRPISLVLSLSHLLPACVPVCFYARVRFRHKCHRMRCLVCVRAPRIAMRHDLEYLFTQCTMIVYTCVGFIGYLHLHTNTRHITRSTWRLALRIPLRTVRIVCMDLTGRLVVCRERLTAPDDRCICASIKAHIHNHALTHTHKSKFARRCWESHRTLSRGPCRCGVTHLKSFKAISTSSLERLSNSRLICCVCVWKKSCGR